MSDSWLVHYIVEASRKTVRYIRGWKKGWVADEPCKAVWQVSFSMSSKRNESHFSFVLPSAGWKMDLGLLTTLMSCCVRRTKVCLFEGFVIRSFTNYEFWLLQIAEFLWNVYQHSKNSNCQNFIYKSLHEFISYCYRGTQSVSFVYHYLCITTCYDNNLPLERKLRVCKLGINNTNLFGLQVN